MKSLIVVGVLLLAFDGSAGARDESWIKRIECEHSVKHDKAGEWAAYMFAIDQYATHWVMSCSAASGGPKGHGTTWSAERRGPGKFGSEGDNPTCVAAAPGGYSYRFSLRGDNLVFTKEPPSAPPESLTFKCTTRTR